MVNELLEHLVGSILGKGKPTSGDNYAYFCPFCNHYKTKLEVNLKENVEGIHKWHCWNCNKRGKKLIQLFKALQVPDSKIEELKSFVKVSYQGEDEIVKVLDVTLPEEYKSLISPNINDVVVRQALQYLRTRGIDSIEIKRYNIGYCETGPYRNMIVIPSYDHAEKLNFYTGRSFRDSNIKHKNPKHTKDIIAFENTINWEVPVIICEGFFDAIAIKRNVIPLIGKTFSENLMKKLVTTEVKKIYIALDPDARKQALAYCLTLLDLGKEVYLIDLKEGDASELGFEGFTELLHVAKPLTLRTLMEFKLAL